jgi:hypothetical protein
MPKVSIEFSWYKDASGYRLVSAGSLAGPGKPPFDVIVPNGGERMPIRPMEIPDIYIVFAYVDSAEKLLEFVEKFGLLGPYEGTEFEVNAYDYDPDDGSEWVTGDFYEGMPVGKYLKQAALFLEVLRRKAEGAEELATFLKSNIARFITVSTASPPGGRSATRRTYTRAVPGFLGIAIQSRHRSGHGKAPRGHHHGAGRPQGRRA